MVGVKPLHQAPVRVPNGRFARSWLKPQDLVGFLLRHRAELKLAPAPVIRTRISVFTPAGNPAVEIRFEQTGPFGIGGDALVVEPREIAV